MTVMQVSVPEPAGNRGASEIAAAEKGCATQTNLVRGVGSEQLPRVVRTDC